MGGGSENTPLEIALARHALELHESLAKAKRERGEAKAKYSDLFEKLYSVFCTISGIGDEITELRKTQLEALSKAAFAKALKFDNQLKQLG